MHVFVGLGALALAGCGLIDLDFEELTETDTVTEATRLPEQDPALVSTAVADDRITFTYASPPDPNAFAAGNVIVGRADGGYLREVASVEAAGNTLVVHTRPAVITDAIANLHAAETIEPAPAQRALSLLDLSGRVLVDTKIQNVPVKITVVRGTLDLEPAVDFELDITRAKLEHVGVTAKGTLALDLDLELEVGGTVTFADEIDLSGPTAVLYEYPFVIFVPTLIGPLPVAGTIELDAFAGFSATVAAQASVTAGLGGSSSFTLRAAYDDGGDWTVEGVPAFEGMVHPPELTTVATADARAYVRPELRVRFYKVAGPRASITPALKTKLALTPTPSASFEGCVSGEIGFDVSLFGKQLVDLAHSFPEVCRALPTP